MAKIDGKICCLRSIQADEVVKIVKAIHPPPHAPEEDVRIAFSIDPEVEHQRLEFGPLCRKLTQHASNKHWGSNPTRDGPPASKQYMEGAIQVAGNLINLDIVWREDTGKI